MFMDAPMYTQKMCEWNLEGKSVTNMFGGNSGCSVAECIDCNNEP